MAGLGETVKNRQEKIVDILIKDGRDYLKEPREKMLEFTGNYHANRLLSNMREYPHAYVLACIMDRQIKYGKAWIIPYEISREIGGFEFKRLLKLSERQIYSIFKRKHLHRFNKEMAKSFYLALRVIRNEYGDDAGRIWSGRPSSAKVVYRFLRFRGVGPKIATMAVNILARDFKIKFSDYSSVDISADRHVVRVFKRLGFVPHDADENQVIYCARSLYPRFPGIFDLACFEIGHDVCHVRNPECKTCSLNKYCPKNIR